ncbi:MAG: hypothetical protein LBM13_02095 [Candidatus Ancillula sp.]|nr:hypothetical protein [Candidatus Ancillula sp.]
MTKKLAAFFILIMVMIVGLSSCSIAGYSLGAFEKNKGDFREGVVTPINWKVGISFPNSGFSLFDESTVGRWSMIQEELVSQLQDAGYQKGNIIVKSENNRKDQISDIQDLINKDINQLIVVPTEFTKKELQSGASDTKPLEGQDKSLVDVLNQARSNKTFVGILGPTGVDSFNPDYLFATPSVEDVANVQAGYVESHLNLPGIRDDGTVEPALSTGFKPKNLEILAADAIRDTTKRYFTTIWNRLKPYFDAGYLKSASGLLTKDTEPEDYKKVAVVEEGDKSAGVMHNIINKYYKNANSTTIANKQTLDVALGQTDAQARGIIRAAVEFGWTADDSFWPLVLGANTEKSSLLDIVEDKQAMSIAYDSKALVLGIVEVLQKLALNEPYITKADTSMASNELKKDFSEKDGTLYVENVTTDTGVVYPTIVARPVTIQPDNIKSFLVDKGYASAQDAGI